MIKPLRSLIFVSALAWSAQTNAQLIISGISASSITEKSAVITWTTNIPGNSQVNFGTTTSYGSFTLVDPTSATSHSMILHSLAPGTLYHFQVGSAISGGSPATSGDYSFTTATLASSLGSLNTHTVFAYPSGKIVAWTPNPTDGYTSVVASAWNYLLNSVPNDPSTGKPAYYSRSYLNPSTQQVVNWDHNPAGLYGMLTESAIKYFGYSANSGVMQLANDVALWHLDHGMTTATDSWASVPYSEGPYGSLTYNGANQSDGVGNLEPDKIGELAYAWLQLYKYNGNVRFRDAAIQSANVLAAKIRVATVSQSPWPFRVKASNGNVIEQYCSNIIGPISLFDGLIAAGLGNTSAYQTARTSAWNWMMTYPMQNNAWAQYFEDVGIESSYNSNLNQYNAMMVARYLLEHPEYDANWETHVRGLIAWVKSNFGQSSLGSTIIKEQEVFFYAMGSHTSRYASVNALLYEKTGDMAAKEEAYRSFNWATYMAKSNGIVIDGPEVNNQWFTDGYGDYIRHFMTGLAAVPEWTPFTQTHLLRSTSVIKSISYGLNTVSYTTYDASSTEVIHVNFTPLTITANGVVLPRRTDLSQPGWTLDVATKTLRIYHTAGTQIAINSQGAGPLPVTLADFTGTIVNNNSVNLAWKTYSELNSKEFVIERSADGANFETIHVVAAAGTSNIVRNYSYLDNNLPQKLILYYRLKQVDQDGQYQYSNVVRIRFKAGSFYINNIYPQPATASINIDVTNVNERTICTMAFVNVNGATVKSSTAILNKGNNIIDVNISSLAKGVYFLKLISNETQVVERVLKE
ncbi:MAG: T9SS type A sorting domain-containing protein [Chitinophagales bacterium]